MSDSATPWTAAHQASLSITNSQSLLKLMSIESVMPSNHLILCRPLHLLPSVFPSIRVFSNESVLCIRWSNYWSFSFSISPSNEHPGLISFRIDWLDFLAVQGTLKSLLQHDRSKEDLDLIFFATWIRAAPCKAETLSIDLYCIWRGSLADKSDTLTPTAWGTDLLQSLFSGSLVCSSHGSSVSALWNELHRTFCLNEGGLWIQMRRVFSLNNIPWKKSDIPKFLIFREVYLLFLLCWFMKWYLWRTHLGVGVSELLFCVPVWNEYGLVRTKDIFLHMVA